MTSDVGMTENVFARLLVFYHKYNRDKINADDLGKVAKKYAKRPEKLIPDLESKYPHKIPSQVHFYEISRVKCKFQLPESYTSLLPTIPTKYSYSLELDPTCDQFNPLKALQERSITMPPTGLFPMDNMSKARILLPESDERYQVQAFACANMGTPREFNSKVTDTHILDKIAAIALRSSKANHNEYHDSHSSESNPLSLIQTFMKNRSRILVIVRRNNSIRGRIQVIRNFVS